MAQVGPSAPFINSRQIIQRDPRKRGAVLSISAYNWMHSLKIDALWLPGRSEVDESDVDALSTLQLNSPWTGERAITAWLGDVAGQETERLRHRHVPHTETIWIAHCHHCNRHPLCLSLKPQWRHGFLLRRNWEWFLDPEGRSPNAILVVLVLVLVVISSLKMPKAFLIRSGAQWNFAHTLALTFSTDLPSQSFKLISN